MWNNNYGKHKTHFISKVYTRYINKSSLKLYKIHILQNNALFITMILNLVLFLFKLLTLTFLVQQYQNYFMVNR